MTELEKATAKVEEVATAIDERLKAVEEQVKDKGSYNEELKGEVKNLVEKWEEYQKQVDTLETNLKSLGMRVKSQPKTFGDMLKENLEDHEKYKNRVKGAQIGEFSFNLKAPATMLQSTHLTGDVIEPDRQPGTWFDPERNVRVRQIMSQGTMGSNAVSFIQEQNFEDGAGTVAEGGALTQSDFDLVEVTESAKKIGTYAKVSAEMLEDIEGLASYIGVRLGAKIKLEEDTQIISGSGTGNNLNGLVTQATAFSTSTNVTQGHLLDVLALAVSQAKIAEYMPTAIICNPADTEGLFVAKDGDKRYLHPWIYTSEPLAVMGVPILESTAISADTFLVGDFRRACQLFDRRMLTVEFSDSDQDDFIKNLVTVRVTERLVLAVYNTQSFITGTISTEIGNITVS